MFVYLLNCSEHPVLRITNDLLRRSISTIGTAGPSTPCRRRQPGLRQGFPDGPAPPVRISAQAATAPKAEAADRVAEHLYAVYTVATSSLAVLFIAGARAA